LIQKVKVSIPLKKIKKIIFCTKLKFQQFILMCFILSNYGNRMRKEFSYMHHNHWSTMKMNGNIFCLFFSFSYITSWNFNDLSLRVQRMSSICIKITPQWAICQTMLCGILSKFIDTLRHAFVDYYALVSLQIMKILLMRLIFYATTFL
jgi:hypothetical protein